MAKEEYTLANGYDMGYAPRRPHNKDTKRNKVQDKRQEIMDLVNDGEEARAVEVLHDYIREQTELTKTKKVEKVPEKKEGCIAKLAKTIFGSNTRHL